MSDHLSVDGAGLNIGGHRSADIADELAASTIEGFGWGTQPSHAGVSAFDTALVSTRARQSARAGGQSAKMHAASAMYTHTDDDAAGGLSRVL